MLDKKAIGLRIKSRRKSLKMTQGLLSEISQISPAYISKIESGQQNYTLETLEKIAESIKEDPVYLISGIKCDEKNCIIKILSKTSVEFQQVLSIAFSELIELGILTVKT